MKRRTFLKATATAVAMIVTKPHAEESEMKQTHTGKLPKRAYGKTGVELSVIGFGGIVVMNLAQPEANRIVAEAVERGVNYFDVAPTYGDAEERLGPALEPYRKDVFLACKTTQREREAAEMEFNRSLERLRTDHFDLYQLHGITSVEKDVDPVFVKGGVMDMLVEKRKAGQIRFIGFSAHSTEAALAAMDRFDFDSILFPFNFAAYHKGKFGPEVMARAQEKGVARLALKAMAKQRWPENDPLRERFSKCWYQPVSEQSLASLALRWTLSQPVTAAIPPGEVPLFRMALDIAEQLKPIAPEEEKELIALAEQLNPVFQAA